jgi:hypothetical protein
MKFFVLHPQVVSCTWDTLYFNMVVSTCTWDLGLWYSLLENFNFVARICTWDPIFLAYFNIEINAYPWDPGLWSYLLTRSIEGNDFIRRVGCCDPPYGCNGGKKSS